MQGNVAALCFVKYGIYSIFYVDTFAQIVDNFLFLISYFHFLFLFIFLIISLSHSLTYSVNAYFIQSQSNKNANTLNFYMIFQYTFCRQFEWFAIGKNAMGKMEHEEWKVFFIGKFLNSCLLNFTDYVASNILATYIFSSGICFSN